MGEARPVPLPPQIAPAKMFICMRYEPELYAVNGTGTGEAGTIDRTNAKFWGSPAHYRGMWARTRALFDAAGVDQQG